MPTMISTSTAYLIIECDKDTHAIVNAHIWSSPEWEQSRHLDNYTYVAYSVKQSTFQKGIDYIKYMLADPLLNKRYKHLLGYLGIKEKKELKVNHLTVESNQSSGTVVKANISNEVPCVEFTMKKGPQTIMIACEPWVQFPPDEWNDMIRKTFKEMVQAWNEIYEEEN